MSSECNNDLLLRDIKLDIAPAEDELERTVVIPTLSQTLKDIRNGQDAVSENAEGKWLCGKCTKVLKGKDKAIGCEGMCSRWFHDRCVLSEEEQLKFFEDQSTEPWHCKECVHRLQESIRWGKMIGEEEIGTKLDEVYTEMITWRSNLFEVPRGRAGKDYIEEVSRILSEFTYNTKWKPFSLKLVHVFMPLMLQRPTPKSKPKQNTKYLRERLKLWADGEIDAIMKQCRQIQAHLDKKQKVRVMNHKKDFCRLMLQGRVQKALKYINDEEKLSSGVHNLTQAVIDELKKKHPEASPEHPEVMLEVKSELPDQVIYESIDADLIQKVAKDLDGAGGPTKISAHIFKHMICSRFHSTESDKLAQTVADLTKKLCTEQTPSSYLKEFLAGRLIPLDKEPGSIVPAIRPIGIGEVLRRIVAKAVTRILKLDIQMAAGSLQTCSGTESGIEAAIHGMKAVFEDEDCEAVLLIDAKNAFNSLNRKVALNNIRELCPSLHCFLQNCYQDSTDLYIVDEKGQLEIIKGEDGSTQGDPAAMAKYAISIRPLMDDITRNQDHVLPLAKQAWFADDGTAGGKLLQLKKLWDTLQQLGPKYGYFPNATKTVLIVKDLVNLPAANAIFKDTGVHIKRDGDRHLGAVIGSENYRDLYVKNKVSSWIEDVKQLAEIAKEEPQIAYSAYTKGLSHRWSFVQRTIGGISELFRPLEEAIRTILLPSIFNRPVTDLERDMVALPLRHGGLGIQNPVHTADREYEASQKITKPLANLIYNQDHDLGKLDLTAIANTKAALKAEKEKDFAAERLRIENAISSPAKKRSFSLAAQKGSSSWLSALPMQSYGYCLNKKDFRDGICLRYGWPIQDIAKHCACGERNSVDHALSCKKGGYVSFRHTVLVETEADLLREAKCRNVYTEPALLPTSPELHPKGTTTDSGARLDIVATGLYGRNARTFMDVRITHPNAPSNLNVPLDKLYKRNEEEKKTKYNSRVINTERASFIPLVFSTAGTTAPECDRFHKRLARLISKKRKESYTDVINYIRTKICFAMLKSIVVSVHGVRSQAEKKVTKTVADTAFGLIPSMTSYECR